MSVTDPKQKIIRLTNDVGEELKEDGDMQGAYEIAASGAGNLYFYISHDGKLNTELIFDQFFVDAAVTLQHQLQLYVGGVWRSISAYDIGEIDAAAAQEINASYPLRDMITSGTKSRVQITVSGACSAFCKVVGV